MATGLLTTPDLDTLIALHRGQIRRKEYTPLGQLTRLMLEPATPALPDPSKLNQIQSVLLDWYRKKGPQLAIAQDSFEILIVTPMIAAPPIPEPSWGHSGKRNGDGHLQFEAAPMIEQNMLERATGVMESKEGDWLVFQPILQLEFRAFGKASWGIAQCFADSEGKHTALIYKRTGEAHFLFGRKEIRIY